MSPGHGKYVAREGRYFIGGDVSPRRAPNVYYWTHGVAQIAGLGKPESLMELIPY